MSAIAGLLRLDGGLADPEACEALMRAMERYAADEVRTWSGGPVFLGCRIRRITPESVFEPLPGYDPDSGLAVAADAILDNRGELFDRLQVPPDRRSRTTDSELIVLAYRRWGRRAPEYLIGDFAFALWDRDKRILFAARDLFGNRSLYYRLDGRGLAFCTAMAPLLALPGAVKALNEPWLAEFLAIPEMFECTDVQATPYRHILQVPPGHALVVADGRLSLADYGSSALEPEETLRLKSDAAYEEAFRAVFGEAVRARIRTFRQVAATLSGGLDSGAVAGFAARALREEGKKLHTYSYVPPRDFADWTPGSTAADERPYIRATVRHAGNIEARYMDFAGVSPWSEIDEWLDILEAPYKFFENSFWLKGIHQRAAREGAGVLLTGARGNFTISWGPAIPYYAMLLRRLKWARLTREIRLYSANRGIGRARLMSAIGRQALPLLAQRTKPDRGADIPAMLIHPDFARRTGVFARLRDRRSGPHAPAASDPLALRKEKLRNLAAANKNGATATKLSLRYGVWERDPTCDPRVVRFCLSLPFDQYVRSGMDRALVRRAAKGLLPDKVRLNQRVRGIQGADWVHRVRPAWRALADELRELCGDPVAAGYLHVERIRAAVARIGEAPRPEQAFDPELRMLMRSLIVYRFLKRFS
mgnify:CR=1 FL=1